MPTNYLSAAVNPFGLQPPPAWFLRELQAFDNQLVVFPSQQTFHYRLTRRKNRSPGITKALSWSTDSATCVENGLIPVTSIAGDYVWGPSLFQWLRDRDMWAHGGTDGVERIMDEKDRLGETRIQKDLDSENVARAKSMYRTYKTRAGEIINLSDRNRGRVGQPKDTKRIALSLSGPGSAPVPPAGWNESPAGLITPPTL